jgi:hypothetical protein
LLYMGRKCRRHAVLRIFILRKAQRILIELYLLIASTAMKSSVAHKTILAPEAMFT